MCCDSYHFVFSSRSVRAVAVGPSTASPPWWAPVYCGCPAGTHVASVQSANPCWCVPCVVVVRSRGSIVLVLVKCSSDVDIMCIHQHSSSFASGSCVGRPTVDAYTCVSFRQVRFDMAGVTDVKHSCGQYCALAGVSNHQHNNPSLCCRTGCTRSKRHCGLLAHLPA